VAWLAAAMTVLCLTGVHGDPKPKIVGNSKDSDDDGTVSVVDIADHNKTQYLNQNFEDG